jgi:general stress protein YciG
VYLPGLTFATIDVLSAAMDEQENVANNAVPEPALVKPKRLRGFAAMSRAQLTAISKAGGVAAHAQGTAHEFTSEEARVAGRKGGRALKGKKVRSEA